MKRTTIVLSIAAAAIAVTTIGALARERGPDFSTLDIDGNGELTQEELSNAAAARFATIDTDGNGSLSKAELEAQASERAAKRADRMIERLDANEDGELSAEEMADGRKRGRDLGRMFERIDADDSGTITQAEFDEARDKFRGKRGKKRSSD